MAEIINLNRARKARAKATAGTQAEANRAKHGRTKAERLAEEEAAAKRERDLDGAQRD